MIDLPLVTGSLAGIGGRIKSEAAHFVVEEIPLYPASGAGEHVYVRHRRSDRTTRELVLALARTFALDPRDIGYAGMKDKRAIATQTFSLQLHKAELADVARRIEAEIGGEVLDVQRHLNKLRRGHLIGNRFVITVDATIPGADQRAREIAAELGRRGVPNFFGPQRYGEDGRNAERGRALIARPKRGWLAELHLSAWQSSLFDRWLADRMQRGDFERVLAGDVAKKLDNGALFDVVDPEKENERVARREITHSGPMFGSKMRATSGFPAELEAALLATQEVTLPMLAKARLEGTRRAGRIFVDDIAVEPVEAGLRLSFQLPKGSYATNVLREFMKSSVVLAEDED
jgi:tRNA pseudouridine13 synthase